MKYGPKEYREPCSRVSTSITVPSSFVGLERPLGGRTGTSSFLPLFPVTDEFGKVFS